MWLGESWNEEDLILLVLDPERVVTPAVCLLDGEDVMAHPYLGQTTELRDRNPTV